ncbi:MAG TPA: DUF2530 domain-containing protein [Candidatus Nanopelagicaceae bacterium]
MAQNVRSVVLQLALCTCAWVVAGVIAILVNAQSKIIWTCVSGTGLGLIGIYYTIRRARRSGI